MISKKEEVQRTMQSLIYELTTTTDEMDFYGIKQKDLSELVEMLTVINNYINQSPTSEEVCKALWKWGIENDEFDQVMVKGDTIYTDDGTLCYLTKDGNIELIWNLPPHLITMIGEFYEALNK